MPIPRQLIEGFIGLLALLGLACNLALPIGSESLLENQAPVVPDPSSTSASTAVSQAVHPTATRLPTSTPSTPMFTPTPAATEFNEPAGCLKPPDDYTRVQVNNATLNARTFWMLQRAEQIYGGTIPISGAGITQGSYNPGGVAASFGTHDGGGAVDITVRNIPVDWSIKWNDIPKMVDALRLAGFAAFFRDEREDLVPHIHAIAIGDRDLSFAAQQQLTGRYGYFRGYDGFPREDGVPLKPRYGNLVICQWMLDMGYQDLRGQPLPQEPEQP